MASYRFSAHAKAPPELVFDLWTNLERMAEWVGGVTGVGCGHRSSRRLGRRGPGRH